MKRTIREEELLAKDDIWNAVVSILSAHDLSSENTLLDEAFIVFHYYSELESGGHESLLNWFESYRGELSIDNYLMKLIAALEKMGAHEFAFIEKKYGKDMWRLHATLENGEDNEEEYYQTIEKADQDYYNSDQTLADLVENYFIDIHAELMDVLDG